MLYPTGSGSDTSNWSTGDQKEHNKGVFNPRSYSRGKAFERNAAKGIRPAAAKGAKGCPVKTIAA